MSSLPALVCADTAGEVRIRLLNRDRDPDRLGWPRNRKPRPGGPGRGLWERWASGNRVLADADRRLVGLFVIPRRLPRRDGAAADGSPPCPSRATAVLGRRRAAAA